jgi:hypothetical protein
VDLFNEKVKGKDVGFVLGIKGNVPYPEKNTRWDLFGKPLCSYVNPYYEKCAVEYFMDESKQFLTAINVICWNSKFTVSKKEDEAQKFYGNFYSAIYRSFESFFNSRNIEFELEKMFNPMPLEKEAHDFILKKRT